MVSPGDLVKGHDKIETDCLACHQSFGGPGARCAGCHEVARIDEKRTDRPPFHAALADHRSADEREAKGRREGNEHEEDEGGSAGFRDAGAAKRLRSGACPSCVRDGASS